MAIHNRSHHNSALMSLNKMNKDNIKHKSSVDFKIPNETNCVFLNKDCLELLRSLPDESVQLILLDPPYNLDLASWDTYDNYIEWASKWIEEAYRVLSKSGSLVIFGGTQFQNVRSGDLIEIIYYCRHFTKFRLVNTIVWYYKNGMSAHRYFANRHEEIIWLTKTDKYYFDLDAVRVPYPPRELELALKDKRLRPENVRKGKNPTNVWEMGRLNGNSKERVGHPTQKPLDVIRRLVKALSYPDSIVLDFFAGSGTTGRVCIEEKRNCILCDNDKQSMDFFEKHLENMNKSGMSQPFILNDSLDSFFTEIKKREEDLDVEQEDNPIYADVQLKMDEV